MAYSSFCTNGKTATRYFFGKHLFKKQNRNRNKIKGELSNELKDSLPYADKVTLLTDLEFASGTGKKV